MLTGVFKNSSFYLSLEETRKIKNQKSKIKNLGAKKMTDQPHAFSKKLNKSIVAAEIVLGGAVVKELVSKLIVQISFDKRIMAPFALSVAQLLKHIEESLGVCVTTPKDLESKGVTVHTNTEKKNALASWEGYTLVDLTTAIKESAAEDLRGFLLEVVQYRWGKEVTIDQAEKIAHHVSELTKILK